MRFIHVFSWNVGWLPPHHPLLKKLECPSVRESRSNRDSCSHQRQSWEAAHRLIITRAGQPAIRRSRQSVVALSAWHLVNEIHFPVAISIPIELREDFPPSDIDHIWHSFVSCEILRSHRVKPRWISPQQSWFGAFQNPMAGISIATDHRRRRFNRAREEDDEDPSNPDSSSGDPLHALDF